ncbi:hypothetical protein J2Z23_003696 [Lederbergia galactosidilyticus]|nr:hypothetical protein [Lederbergia galactosidilytica]
MLKYRNYQRKELSLALRIALYQFYKKGVSLYWEETLFQYSG